MICKRCGSQIFNNAKTCPFCAAVVGAENETDPNQTVIPDLESLPAPGSQSPAPGSQMPASGSQMPDMPELSFDTPSVSPVQPPVQPAQNPAAPQQNPFDLPQGGVQPPQNPFGQPQGGVQPPQNPFGQPQGGVQPPQNPFGQPESGFQPPQNAFEQPQGGVQPPQNAFGQPQSGFQLPQNAFGQPESGFQLTQNAFGQPESGVQPPQNAFGQPQNGVQPPQNPFGQPEAPATRQDNSFGVPQQSAAFGQTGSTPSQNFAPLPPLSGGGGASGTGSALAGIPIRLLAKILIVLGLLCFALPFVTVSCSMGEYGGGDKEIATYSGFDLMAANLDYEDPAKQMNDSLSNMFGEEFVNNEDGESDFDQIFNADDDDPLISYQDIDEDEDAAAAAEEDEQKKNYWLIGAFICGIAALVILFIKDKQLEIFSMVASLLAAMLTLVSSMTFSSFYNMTESSEMADLLKVKTRYGVYVVVVMFVLGALASLKEHIDVNVKQGY